MRTAPRQTALATIPDAAPHERWMKGLAVGLLLGATFSATSAHAAYSGIVTEKGYGFDKCTAPTSTEMSNAKNHGSITWIALYQGPISSCGTASSSAYSNAFALHLGVVPIWVDAQSSGWVSASCTAAACRFSDSVATAATSGTTAARNAVTGLRAVGFTGTTPIYLDLEGYTYSAAREAAASAYVNAFVQEVHAEGFYAGVYGSAGGSRLTNFASIAHPPDYIWGALWNATTSVFAMDAYINDALWAFDQRLRQYAGPGSVTWGTSTMTVDRDCADGRVATSTSTTGNVAGCYSR